MLKRFLTNPLSVSCLAQSEWFPCEGGGGGGSRGGGGGGGRPWANQRADVTKCWRHFSFISRTDRDKNGLCLFYCIQHRHCRPKLWLYSLIFLVLQQFSSCSEPTTRSRPVPINSSSVKLFPAWSFKILFCGEQDAKKLRFKPKPSPDCWTIKPKPWRLDRAKRGKSSEKKHQGFNRLTCYAVTAENHCYVNTIVGL